MADIELVIKIDEEKYNRIMLVKNGIWGSERLDSLEYAVVNGTPLPKGHGQIRDTKDIYELLNKERDDNFVLRVDAIVQRVKPIIKADTESEG